MPLNAFDIEDIVRIALYNWLAQHSIINLPKFTTLFLSALNSEFECVLAQKLKVTNEGTCAEGTEV